MNGACHAAGAVFAWKKSPCRAGAAPVRRQISTRSGGKGVALQGQSGIKIPAVGEGKRQLQIFCKIRQISRGALEAFIFKTQKMKKAARKLCRRADFVVVLCYNINKWGSVPLLENKPVTEVRSNTYG